MKKKIVVLIAAAFFGGMALVSCGGEESQNHDAEQHDHSSHAQYQCPMDCEHGKTYEEAGQCPVCKMDLEEVKDESNQE